MSHGPRMVAQDRRHVNRLSPKHNLERVIRWRRAIVRGATMSAIPATFRAFVAEKVAGSDPAGVERGVREFHEADLPPGEVEIRVDWSSVNYKDGLADAGGRQGRPDQPVDPGDRPRGRSSSRARTPRSRSARRCSPTATTWVSPGTAATPSTSACRPTGSCRWRPASRRATRWRSGPPASPPAMSVVALEDRGLSPDDGPVLVTGASGGVGGTALAILADRGYEVWAATGKTDEAARLRTMGAAGILTRDEVTGDGPAARIGTMGRGGRRGRCRDAAIRPANAADRGGGRGLRERRRGRARRRPSSRSSCAASRCSGWIR